MMVGIWLFGRLADKIGRKPTFILFQVCAVASILIYSQLSDPTAMLFAGAILGASVNGMMGGYGALMAEATQQLLVQQLKTYYLISVVL